MNIRFFKEYTSFFQIFLIFIALFIVGRLSLIAYFEIPFDALLFLYGLRMDIIVISAFFIVPIILYTFNCITLTRVLLTLLVTFSLFLEASNYFFFAEFNSRLNYIFIDYLQYPKTVGVFIWNSYKTPLVILLFFMFAASFFVWKHTTSGLIKSSVYRKLIVLPFILIFLFIGLRSSFDSSTPNPSFYSYSNSVVKNQIANNTIFSLLYALYQKSKVKQFNFGAQSKEPIQDLQALQSKQYLNKNTLLHLQKSTHTKKGQIVLILMESFGTSYVGSLGGTPTTPFFDKMSSEGLFCANMYSSSNRSNRGFEATLSSIFPVAEDTYLKLYNSQNNFWTIAKSMKKHGYTSVFLYGGDSAFDNMKGFALNNGFDKVLDKNDFESSIPRYTWGVSDEALYKKAQDILESSDKPIFLLLFTLSSHKPFDYPDNKIELYQNAQKESFPNSIKYADFALGHFYKTLQNNNFFDKGVLTIVADHNAHMLGDFAFPVNEYKIPALFLAKDVVPQVLRTVTHQIDIAPTLLDIAGIDDTIPAMGRNLSIDTNSSALITSKNSFAYLKNDRFVIFENNKKPVSYDFSYNQISNDEQIITEGLNYIYGTRYIYTNQLHKDTNE